MGCYMLTGAQAQLQDLKVFSFSTLLVIHHVQFLPGDLDLASPVLTDLQQQQLVFEVLFLFVSLCFH